ncbi:MAG: hypothetical protein U0836_14970 [Pirellulales bacterium]
MPLLSHLGLFAQSSKAKEVAAPRLVPYAELERKAAENSKKRFVFFGDSEIAPGSECVVSKIMEWRDTPLRRGGFSTPYSLRLLGCAVVQIASGAVWYVELPAPVDPWQDDWTILAWSDRSLVLVDNRAFACLQRASSQVAKPQAFEWRFSEQQLTPLEGFKPAHSLAATLSSLGIKIAPALAGNACQWDGAVSLIDPRGGRHGRFLTQNTWRSALRMATRGPLTEDERDWVVDNLDRHWMNSEQYGPSFDSSTVLYLQRFAALADYFRLNSGRTLSGQWGYPTPLGHRIEIGCTSLFHCPGRAPLRWSRGQDWLDKAAGGVVKDARFVPGQSYPADKLSLVLVVDHPQDQDGDRQMQWRLLNTATGELERQLPIRLEPALGTEHMPAVVNATGTLGAGIYTDDGWNERFTLYDLAHDQALAHRDLDRSIAGFDSKDSLILYDRQGIWRLDPPYDRAPREVIKPWPTVEIAWRPSTSVGLASPRSGFDLRQTGSPLGLTPVGSVTGLAGQGSDQGRAGK